jgi:hypothetical protein
MKMIDDILSGLEVDFFPLSEDDFSSSEGNMDQGKLFSEVEAFFQKVFQKEKTAGYVLGSFGNINMGSYGFFKYKGCWIITDTEVDVCRGRGKTALVGLFRDHFAAATCFMALVGGFGRNTINWGNVSSRVINRGEADGENKI